MPARDPHPRTRPLRRAAARLAPLLALLAVGATALAQGRLIPPVYYLVAAPALEEDTPVTGALTADDGQNFKDGSHLDVYALRGHAGDRVHLSAVSSDFDTYLAVFGPDGALVTANDDAEGGSTTDAAVDLTLDGSGTYLVVVSGYAQEDLGSYTLTRTTGTGAVAAAGAQEVTLPFDVSSALTADMPPITDPNGDPTGPSEAYVFDVGQEALLVVTMSSAEFDAEVFLFDDSGALLGMNDDADPSLATDATLALQVPPGRYRLVATSYDAAGSGAYDLHAGLYQPVE